MLLALALARGHARVAARPRPLARAFALVEIAIPFPLIAAGEQHVDSSLAAIIIASVPLIVALLALRFDHAERATGSRLVGLLIGFAGVVALVGIDVAGNARRAARRRRDPASPRSATRPGRWSSSATLADLDPRATMGAALAIAARRADARRRARPPAEARPRPRRSARSLVLGAALHGGCVRPLRRR